MATTPQPLFAKDTKVSVDKSKAEIEKLLGRHGATHFGYATVPGERLTLVVQVVFQLQNRRIRLSLVLPSRDKFRRDPRTLRDRPMSKVEQLWEQACRQLWRLLVLVVKAKLEAIAAGITTLEAEFLAGVVLPNNVTVGEWAAPQLEAIAQSGQMPPLLGGGQ